jgi:hypothetical protein
LKYLTQSDLCVEELRVLFRVEGKLEVVEHLPLDLAVLEEDNTISVALQILIVGHHHDCDSIFL